MRFASAITDATDLEQATAELLQTVAPRTTAGMVDLGLLFSTEHFRDELDSIVESINSEFPNAVILGCTAEGTIGREKELERVPSLSLLVGSLPDVLLRPFHVRQEDIESAKNALDWERIVAVAPESKPAFIAFADPFRVDVYGFLEQINEAFPGAPLVGGVASAGHEPNENRLIVDGRIVSQGIVGVALTGPFDVQTVVSQGCRPIGKPFVITKAQRNIIRELGGHPALEQLHHVLTDLSEEDEQLARQALFLGRVIDEYKGNFTRGDFLIHNIIGADRKNGAIAIAGFAKVGTTVQFHIRDAETADEDLHALLAPYARTGVCGAMLFGCNGRGTRMWPAPHHDAGVLYKVLGDVPVAGFFCGGEFGPIGGKNFVHGFTASIALFREPESPTRPEASKPSREVKGIDHL